ncbi:MAG: hypothetical protein E7366_00550 [Clostridiales bacterium]|nr:hypothetical protein [Clostridiales bacterium]
MKKIVRYILMPSMIMSLCLGLASCQLIFPDQTSVHTHSYVDGKCECGETDPNYVPPHQHSYENGKCECGETDPNYVPAHQHSFVGGICECGEIDPNHECIFFQGKCIVCMKDNPNPNYVITGNYGVTTEVTVNGKVDVNTVDTKSDEYEDISLTLQEGNVNILDKAWVMYNVTIQPEEGAEEGDVKITTGTVGVPAPVPGVEEYVVYEVQEETVEEVEYVYVNEYIVVDCWDFNYNYLVTTEQSFNVVDYYENADADTTIPDHINVGDKSANDVYNDSCVDNPAHEFSFGTQINGDNVYQIDFYVNGEYRGDNFYFADLHEGQFVTIKAEPIYGAHFLGWYKASVDVDGVLVPVGDAISTDIERTFRMGTEDIKLLACFDTVPTAYVDIWAELENLIYVNGELIEGPDYSINMEAGESVTFSTAANEGYTFLGWYSMDISGNEALYSAEKTITYTMPEIPEPINLYAKYEVTEYFEVNCWDAYSDMDMKINYNGIEVDKLNGAILEKGTVITLTVTSLLDRTAFLGWKDVKTGEYVSGEQEYTFTLTQDTHISPVCTDKRVDVKLVPFEDNQFVEYKYATDSATGEKRIVGLISDDGKVISITADTEKFLGLFNVMATLYNGTEEQIANVPNNFEIIVDERLLPLDENGFATIPGRGSYTISLIDRGDPNVRIDFVITKIDPAGTEYTADFGSFEKSGVSDGHYADRTNDDGWTVTNARCDKQAIDIFATSEQVTLNGVTSNPGKLTSALIKDGSISSLKFKYGYAFNENRTISLTINIRNAEGEIVATTTLLDTTVTQQVGESFTWTLDKTYVGDFTIEIINNCPSGSASTYKDRVSIADLYWYA